MKRGLPVDLLAPTDGLNRVRADGAPAKSGRSCTLLGGDGPTSFKAERIELKSEMPVAEAFQKIAQACIEQFRLNKSALIARRSAEPLHQARVAVRRLRSALSLFETILADEECGRFKRGLRDISHKLGEARDLDVYVARSALSNTGKNVDLHPRAMERAGRARSERDRAYGRVMSALHSKRFSLLMHNLSAWIEAGPWCSMKEHKGRPARDQPILDFAARVLELRWRRLKHRSRHFDLLSPDEHHRIRIKAKKMRYASEFFSSLMADPRHRSRHKMFIAALESLQTSLGNLNDVQAEHEIEAKLARSGDAAAARKCNSVRVAAGPRGAKKERMAALLGFASEAHRRLLNARPFWKS
jgi:triphosphatase